VPCELARMDVSGDGPIIVSSFKKRSVRAVVDVSKKSGYGCEESGFQSKTS